MPSMESGAEALPPGSAAPRLPGSSLSGSGIWGALHQPVLLRASPCPMGQEVRAHGPQSAGEPRAPGVCLTHVCGHHTYKTGVGEASAGRWLLPSLVGTCGVCFPWASCQRVGRKGARW